MGAKKFSNRAIEEALRAAGGMRSGAANILNCSATTITNYVNRSPRLMEICHEIVEAQIDFAETKLISNIKDGRENSILFYLRCKAKHRGYVERTETTGPGGGPIEHTHRHAPAPDFENMSDADLDAYLNDRATKPL